PERVPEAGEHLEVGFGAALFVDQVLEQHLAIGGRLQLGQHFRQVSGKGGLEFVVLTRVGTKIIQRQVAREPSLIERMREEATAGNHRVNPGNHLLPYHDLLLRERADSMQTQRAYQTRARRPYSRRVAEGLPALSRFRIGRLGEG